MAIKTNLTTKASAPEPHLGYTTAAEAARPFAHFLNPDLPPLSAEATTAILRGPRPPEAFLLPSEAHRLTHDDPLGLETGYALTPGGAMLVACRHAPMPGVTPAMWDWWFAWHGHEAARYKLWHPLAHLDVRWADGKGFTGAYRGRTSLVTEYIGGVKMSVGIQFVAPAQAGFDEDRLRARGEVAVCARVLQKRALTTTQVGSFVHHVRPTADGQGAEMRSRFWLGGEFVKLPLFPPAEFVVRTIAGFLPRTQEEAVAMLVHNAEEMAQLATFLPQLYAEFGQDKE